MPKQTGIPEKIADLASKAVADAETPIERARALGHARRNPAAMVFGEGAACREIGALGQG